jgi:hypothetical protein
MDLTTQLMQDVIVIVHCTIYDYKSHSNFLETSCAICTTTCAFILISRENIIIPVPVIKAMFNWFNCFNCFNLLLEI